MSLLEDDVRRKIFYILEYRAEWPKDRNLVDKYILSMVGTKIVMPREQLKPNTKNMFYPNIKPSLSINGTRIKLDEEENGQ